MNSIIMLSGMMAAASRAISVTARSSTRLSSAVAFGPYLPTRIGWPNSSAKPTHAFRSKFLNSQHQQTARASPPRIGRPDLAE